MGSTTINGRAPTLPVSVTPTSPRAESKTKSSLVPSTANLEKSQPISSSVTSRVPSQSLQSMRASTATVPSLIAAHEQHINSARPFSAVASSQLSTSLSGLAKYKSFPLLKHYLKNAGDPLSGRPLFGKAADLQGDYDWLAGLSSHPDTLEKLNEAIGETVKSSSKNRWVDGIFRAINQQLALKKVLDRQGGVSEVIQIIRDDKTLPQKQKENLIIALAIYARYRSALAEHFKESRDGRKKDRDTFSTRTSSMCSERTTSARSVYSQDSSSGSERKLIATESVPVRASSDSQVASNPAVIDAKSNTPVQTYYMGSSGHQITTKELAALERIKGKNPTVGEIISRLIAPDRSASKRAASPLSSERRDALLRKTSTPINVDDHRSRSSSPASSADNQQVATAKLLPPVERGWIVPYVKYVVTPVGRLIIDGITSGVNQAVRLLAIPFQNIKRGIDRAGRATPQQSHPSSPANSSDSVSRADDQATAQHKDYISASIDQHVEAEPIKSPVAIFTTFSGDGVTDEGINSNEVITHESLVLSEPKIEIQPEKLSVIKPEETAKIELEKLIFKDVGIKAHIMEGGRSIPQARKIQLAEECGLTLAELQRALFKLWPTDLKEKYAKQRQLSLAEFEKNIATSDTEAVALSLIGAHSPPGAYHAEIARIEYQAYLEEQTENGIWV